MSERVHNDQRVAGWKNFPNPIRLKYLLVGRSGRHPNRRCPRKSPNVSQRLVTALLEERGPAVTATENGSAVLDLIEQRAFDLIVRDIQMPEMDRLRATTEIRCRESAHAMAGDRERCLDVGMDGHIAKPLHPRELHGVDHRYERAKHFRGVYTRDGMTASNGHSAVQRARLLKEVPPFRPVAIQLLKLVSDPAQSLRRFVELLRTDAVLTAEVLRLANSPLLWCRGEMKDMLQALALLGVERVNSLIVTTSMRALVGPMNRKLALACWRHNLASATICERISQSLKISPERGYVAGLIHDLGRLALMRAFPDYEGAIAQSGSEGSNILATERVLYGMDHAYAGQWLLSQWGCPLDLQIVAGLHENPAAALGPERELVCMVSAASQLANLMNFSAFPGTPQSELQAILASVPQAVDELTDLPALATFVATRVNGVELSLG